MKTKNVIISFSKIAGEIAVPSSKSHTMRALIFASLAKGISKIYNPDFFTYRYVEDLLSCQ